MSKLEENLQEERREALRRIKQEMLERQKNTKYEGQTDENGTPILHSYGIDFDKLIKDE